MAAPGLALPCFSCGGANAKACTGCHLAYFCSKQCQKHGWAEHKRACRDASPAQALELADFVGAGKGAGLRATRAIAVGEEVVREVPLLIAPNKLEQPFGRVTALFGVEPSARHRILTELVAPRIDPASLEPEPEPRQQNEAEVEFAAVVGATLRSFASWRDGAWLESNPTEQGVNTPIDQRLPLGMALHDFIRYLAAFAINSWALPPRPTDDEEREGGGGSALFRVGSKFNHACDPHVAFSFDWQPRRPGGGSSPVGVWTAVRSIAVGEEVSVSYLEDEALRLEVGERRRQLRMKPGMEHVMCSCGRCTAEQQPAAVVAPVEAHGGRDDAAAAEAPPAATTPAPAPAPAPAVGGDELWAGGELDEMD